MPSFRAVFPFASVLLAWLVLAAPSAEASSALGGVITDAATGKPIAGAMVTLYRVLGWSARTSPAQNSTPNTCESNASRGSNPWSQPSRNQGQEVDPSSVPISPAVNPLTTNAQGRFGWTVPAGCWFVLVTAPPSYSPETSPVAGVPTDVHDLNVEMAKPSSQGGNSGGTGGGGVGSNGPSSPPGTAGNPTHLRCVVPRLIGRRLTDAKKALTKAHCGVGRISKLRVKHRGKGKRVEAGTVIRQALRPGVRKRTGSKVAITLAK